MQAVASGITYQDLFVALVEQPRASVFRNVKKQLLVEPDGTGAFINRSKLPNGVTILVGDIAFNLRAFQRADKKQPVHTIRKPDGTGCGI